MCWCNTCEEFSYSVLEKEQRIVGDCCRCGNKLDNDAKGLPLDKVEELALLAIMKYCPGWDFSWSNAKTVAGTAYKKSRKGVVKQGISLSRNLMQQMSAWKVRDTILHEIAHVMAGFQNGHNWRWVRLARSIGCNGERCHTEDTSHNWNWHTSCQKCNQKLGWIRRPKYDHTRYRCNCGGRIRPILRKKELSTTQ